MGIGIYGIAINGFQPRKAEISLSEVSDYCFTYGLKNQMELLVFQLSRWRESTQPTLLSCLYDPNGEQVLFFFYTGSPADEEIFEGQK